MNGGYINDLKNSRQASSRFVFVHAPLWPITDRFAIGQFDS